MIVLDTNVVSAIMREEPDLLAAAWLDRQRFESLWITKFTIFEIRYGIEILEKGRRQKRLEDKFERSLADYFHERILSVDEAAVRAGARFAARRRRAGRMSDFQDATIAGIVITRDAELATRNIRHFDDPAIRVVNPWAA
jgi:predicted nucleic acid-binding protein